MPALSSVQRGSPNSLSRSVGGAAQRDEEGVEGVREGWPPVEEEDEEEEEEGGGGRVKNEKF